MVTRIIVTGRGGTGKSTFTALAAAELKGTKLIIDADPDQCMSALLGVSLHEEGIKTVSEALYEIQKGESDGEIESLPLPDKIDYLLHLSCLYESRDFDILTLGVKWTRGCYCAPNNALRTLIQTLSAGYDYAVFDSPAGLEHINRRVVSEADELFVILDPSAKAVRNMHRMTEIAGTIDFSYRNLNIVANYRFPPDIPERISSPELGRFLGRVEEDELVGEFDWTGRSLLELPPHSPARSSVRRVLEKAELLPPA